MVSIIAKSNLLHSDALFILILPNRFLKLLRFFSNRFTHIEECELAKATRPNPQTQHRQRLQTPLLHLNIAIVYRFPFFKGLACSYIEVKLRNIQLRKDWL